MRFHYIDHISQIKSHIEGRKDFIHVVKDGYQVIDYVFEENDSFDNPFRRECRGLKFDSAGNLIARPLHKFFNYGQKEITYDFSSPHVIMEKMDGSMIHTAMINGELRLCTRMGITDHALEAEKLLTPEQKTALTNFVIAGYTVIFEYVAPTNRIVISYDKPELILLAIRYTYNGSYMDRISLDYWSKVFEVPLVKFHQLTLNHENIISLKGKTVGIEGWVIAWPDGTRVKIKTDEYTQMHRAKSYFDRENMILPIVIDNQCDDIYPALSKEDADRLREYETAVNLELTVLINTVTEAVDYARQMRLTRKDFALNVVNHQPAGLRGCFFGALDEKDTIRNLVGQAVIKNPDLLEVRWNE